MTDQPAERPERSERRSINLGELSKRLRALNPQLTLVRAERPTREDAQVRVYVETTRAELRSAGGKLRLSDPALHRLRIETAIRFLDHKPGEQVKVRLRRSDELDIPLPGVGKKRMDA